MNENYSLVEEFFQRVSGTDEGFDSSVEDVDEIELRKFISSEEKRYFQEFMTK